MISGIIYQNWAIIEISNIEPKYSFLTNWDKYHDSKEISKICVISNIEYFILKLKELLNINISSIPSIPSIPSILSYYPKISVILSVYNGEKTLKNAIKSILKQSYKSIELIVINDGSNDLTDKIIEKYKNRVKVITQKENKGVYFCRNIGIKESTGDFIAIQDADDISDLERIEKSIEFLIKGNYEFILSNGKYIKDILNNTSSIKVTMATLLCNKKFFKDYGYYDENTKHSGDLEILDRAYFIKYGNYKFDNFWYWLNYTSTHNHFYGHIYENLYYIGLDGDRITKKNNIGKRLKYLNERRKYFTYNNINKYN